FLLLLPRLDLPQVRRIELNEVFLVGLPGSLAVDLVVESPDQSYYEENREHHQQTAHRTVSYRVLARRLRLSFFYLLVSHHSPPSDIEPGGYQHVFDSETQPEDQLHRHANQDRYGKKLESQILERRRALEYLLLEFAPVDYDVNNQPRHQVEQPYNDKSEDGLPWLPTNMKEVRQVLVYFVYDLVVVPGLAVPEPDPARAPDKRADNDQRDPHEEPEQE